LDNSTIEMNHLEFLEKAIELAVQNVGEGGGPFGAVIVREGEIIATGCNRVTGNNDPTAHAEIQAIREACRKLNTFSLRGCVLYSSCEPCPMCLSAIYWARLDRIYYAATHKDAARAGFDDSHIYQEVRKKPSERQLAIEQLKIARALDPFNAWDDQAEKIPY